MFALHLLASTALISCYVAAQSACTGPQYNTLLGFPAYSRGCYPLGYYQTSDLGNTSPTDAQNRCQQQCSSMSQCQSVVAQVNEAADQPNFYPSGTCFFYNSQNTPNGPRRCADTAYLLEGYYKDSTSACFSRSSSAASAFCSSYLSIPVVTSTATSTPAVVSTTITTTTTTTPITSSTLTIPVTASTTVTTTSTATQTLTQTETETDTETDTATQTVTVTAAAVSSVRKRWAALAYRAAAAPVPAPACITSGTPATRLSAACSCLNVPKSTTTSTKTLVPSTTTLTATATVTTTSTSTVPLTVTATTLSLTMTKFTTLTITTTSTSTTTSTTSTTVTATVTVTPTGVAPDCDGNTISTGPQSFCEFYRGSGAINSFDASGQQNYPSTTTTADAKQNCADFATAQNAHSFRVYKQVSDGTWNCELQATANCNSNFVPNSNIATLYQFDLVGSFCNM